MWGSAAVQMLFVTGKGQVSTVTAADGIDRIVFVTTEIALPADATDDVLGGARALVAAALDDGGTDNATAVVVAVPNHVPVPSAPRRVERASLEGLDLEQLAALVDEADALV